MPSASYLYEIDLNASKALTSAQAFATQLQRTLGNVKLSGLNVTQLSKGLQSLQTAAAQTGSAAGISFGQAMEQRIQGLQLSTAKMGLSSMLDENFMNQMYTAMLNPSKQALSLVDSTVSGMEGRIRQFSESVKRLGVTPQEWLQASGLEQYMMSLQAAQRRVWGIRGMGAQIQAYGGQMMMGGMAGLGGAAAAAKQYADFAEPLNRAARNLELNAQMTELLDSKLRNLAATTSVFTPEEQASGLYQWAAATGEVARSAGELDTLLERVGAVQKLASLGMVDYGRAVEVVTDIQSQYQMNVADTEKIVATLVKVAAVSKAEVGDLGEAFKYAGTYAEQTNTSFTETAAIFQLLSAYGLRGSMAGRGMARLMENLIAPSKQAKGVMDELFTDVFGRTDVLITAEGQFVGMANAIEILATATEGLTQAERNEFAAKITTQNAARVLLPLLNGEIEARKLGISTIEEMEKTLDDLPGTSSAAFQQMMKDQYGYTVSTKDAAQTLKDQWEQFINSTDGQVKRLQASFSASMVSIGGSVLKIALPAIQRLAEGLSSVAYFADSHPGAVGAALTGMTALVSIGALLSVMGKGITLYADAKALLMAYTFKRAVDQFGLEVAAFAASAKVPTAAVGATATRLGEGMLATPLAGAAVAKGGGWKGFAQGLGAAAASASSLALIFGAVVFAVGELGSRLSTGRSYLDLMSTTSEAFAANMKAAADASEIMAGYEGDPARQEVALEARIAALQKKIDNAEKLRQAMSYSPGAEYGTWGELKSEQQRLLKLMPPEAQVKDLFGNLTTNEALLNQVVAEATAAMQAYKVQLDLLRGATEAEKARVQAEAFAGVRGLGPAFEQGREYMEPGADALIGPAKSVTAAFSDLARRAQLGEFRDRMYELGDSLGLSTGAVDVFIASMGGLSNAMARVGSTVETSIQMIMQAGAVPLNQQQVAGMMASSTQGAWSQAQQLQGIGWSPEQIIQAYGDYLSGLDTVFAEAREKGAWEAELYVQAYDDAFDRMIQGNLDAHEQMKQNAKQAIEDQKKAYESAQQGLRGFVEQAFQPTQVTEEDIAATKAGAYKEKWDEAARQMRAAMAGSADFKQMIPDSVWMQGEKAAYNWGQNWIEQFYAGMHPDQIRWDPLLDSIENALAMAAGKKNLVETALLKLKEERGIEATSEQVLAALGMTGILPPGMMGPGVAGGMAAATPEAMKEQVQQITDNIIAPLTEQFKQADMTEPANAVVGKLQNAMQTQMGTFNYATQVHNQIKANVNDQGGKDQLKSAGKLIGNALWDGIYAAFESSNIVAVIAHRVIQILNAGGGNQEDTTAGGRGGNQGR